MNRTAPAAHASHDELLLARLYGGDLDELGRADALTQMADCEECAALFADFGAIAGATAAMPVPARPRDFSLTQADAARLRHTVRTRPAIFGAGLRRAFGGSLAALGLVGAVLSGSASLLGQAAGPASNMAYTNAGANAPQAADASQGGSTVALASAAAKSITVPLTPISSFAELNGDGASPAPGPAGTGAVVGPGQTADYGMAAAAGDDTGDSSHKTVAPADQGNQSGIDSRLLWLIGFAMLFAVGLGILVLPWAIGRRRRG